MGIDRRREIESLDRNRLLAILFKLRRANRATFDGGLSEEDIISEVIEAFLQGQLNWEPEKGRLLNYFVRCCSNRMRDHHRRDQKVAGSIDDPEGTRFDRPIDVRSGFAARDLVQKLHARLGPCESLVLGTWETLGDQGNVVRRLSSLTGLTKRRVVEAQTVIRHEAAILMGRG